MISPVARFNISRGSGQAVRPCKLAIIYVQEWVERYYSVYLFFDNILNKNIVI